MAALGPAPDELLGLAGGPPPGAPQSIDLGGGGPPPGGGSPLSGGGGLPPELAGLLGGEGEPPDAGGGERGEQEILDSIRNDLMEYMSVASDEIEKAEAAKMLQIVQKLFATAQQQTEAAQGTSPAIKGMARAIGG